MSLNDLIRLEGILPHLQAATKKQVLQDLSDKAAALSGMSAREIFDALLQRERLGSTGVGHGIAIPHGKIAQATSIFGVFARLDKAIDFDALDGVPVDLIFLIIAPESAGADHLKALARIARFLREPATAAKLRAARDAATIYAMMSIEPTSHAA
ncbi:MAG: PTS IIA-like nitrogen regulatory protein PtsN [Hyphomicrobiales bacterium]|nr:PTS IIA-like nitrogen regulatory protein PtsN [Hyphomicrobiales bacterium]MDE2113575.1 PTS IIA-like nitrogen regulatory protein PtsN [Hyphomicrobiales bacterium]